MTVFSPEVIVWPAECLGDDVDALIADRCAQLEERRAANPTMDALMRRNGWSVRAVVLGILLRQALRDAVES